MKICYMAHGDSIHIQRWLKYFVNQGHEVHLLTAEPAEIEGAFIYDIGNKPTTIIKRWLYYYRVLRIIHRIKPDIFHAQWVYYGSFFAKFKFHPFILTPLGSDIFVIPKLSKRSYSYIRNIVRSADLITINSNSLRRSLIEMGADENRIYEVQRGVDLDVFKQKISDKNILKFSDVKEYSQVVLSTRTLRDLYNIDIIIRSIPFVLDECPDVLYIFIYPVEINKKELIRLAQELHVTDSVRFVGSVEHCKIVPYYQAADVCVSIPSSDSRPISLLEAMACSLSPIVSDIEAVREVIKDGWNGYIVPPRDPKALADATIKLLKNPNTRMMFGKRGRNLIEKEYNHYKHMKRMEKLYEQLIYEKKSS